MKFYSYWRSSAAYRVRIALGLKNIRVESEYVHLTKEGGQHLKPEYSAINPQKLVPSLVLDDGAVLIQSLAILEYLEEEYPVNPILPSDAAGRARVRAMANLIACDIHPVNNLRILKYLEGEFGVSAEAKAVWYRHWVIAGFEALEAMLSTSPQTGMFCHGDTPGMADICLVPQIYNARRFDVDMDAYPTLQRIEDDCRKLPAFAEAAPENQPDAD